MRLLSSHCAPPPGVPIACIGMGWRTVGVCQAKTGTWNTAGHDAGRAATGAARGALGNEAAAGAPAIQGGGVWPRAAAWGG